MSFSTTAYEPVSFRLVKLLDEACAVAGVARGDITETAYVRISSKDKVGALLHQKDMGASVYADDDQVGPYLNQLTGKDLAGRSSADEERRQRDHGLFAVRDGHLTEHAARTASKRLGWVTVLRRPDGTAVLVAIVADTAWKARIEVPQIGTLVAWVLLVRGLFIASHACRSIKFVKDSRMGRKPGVFATIFEVVGDRPGATVKWGREEIDPHVHAWQAAIGATRASESATELKIAMFEGRLTKLMYSRWDMGEQRLPAILRFRRAEDPITGAECVMKGEVVADPVNVAAFEVMAPLFAHGASKTEVAKAGALAGARTATGRLWLLMAAPLFIGGAEAEVRSVLEQLVADGQATEHERRDVLSALQPSDSHRSTQHRRLRATTGLHQLLNYTFSPRMLDLLRTGRYVVRRYGPIAGRKEYGGFSVTFDAPIGDFAHSRQDREVTNGYVDYVMDWNVPHGVPDTVLDACARRLADEGPAPQGGAATADERRPLAGLMWTTTAEDGDEREVAYRITASPDPATYQIERLDEADRGPRGGWGVAEHVWSLKVSRMHDSVGRMLLDVAEQVEDDCVIPVAMRRLGREPTDLEKARMRVQDLEEREHSLQDQAEEVIDRLMGGGADEFELGLLERKRTGQREERKKLSAALLSAKAELQGLELTMKTEAVVSVETDIQRLRGAGLMLQHTSGKAPQLLAEVLAWLLDGGDLMRITPGDRPLELLLDLHVRIPLADGTIILDAGQDTLVDHRRRIFDTPDKGRRAVTDLAAKALLSDRKGLIRAAEEIDRKPGFAINDLSTWLRDRGVGSPPLRTALITAPEAIPAPAVVYALLTDDLETCKLGGTDTYVDIVRATYLSGDLEWATCGSWLRTDTGLIQRVLDALAATRDGTASYVALSQAIPDLRTNKLRSLLAGTRPLHHMPPAISSGSSVSLMRCPHPGIDDRVPWGGGSKPVTVRELAAGYAASMAGVTS